MPPRYAYWTIILEGTPTAFRSATRDELLPTLKQLQNRHADVRMMWFARGRLWNSPDEAREAATAERRGRGKPGDERRGAGWRPGGQHRDPRARFERPSVWQERRRQRKQRQTGGEPRNRPDRPGGDRSDRPGVSRPDPRRDRPGSGRHDRPRADGPDRRGERPPWQRDRPDRPRTDRPDQPRTDRPDRPRTDQPRTDRPRTDWPDRPRTDRPDRSRTDRSDRPRTDRKPPDGSRGLRRPEDRNPKPKRPADRRFPGKKPGGKDRKD
jgi:hypothetical protein